MRCANSQAQFHRFGHKGGTIDEERHEDTRLPNDHLSMLTPTHGGPPVVRSGSPSVVLAARKGPDMYVRQKPLTPHLWIADANGNTFIYVSSRPAEYWEDSEHILEELQCFLEAREGAQHIKADHTPCVLS